MSLRFPKAANRVGMVGRAPWSERVPLDPLFTGRINSIRITPADQGVRPTLNVDCLALGKLSGKIFCSGSLAFSLL